MLKNYLTIARRNLMRHPAYAFINITGLAVGMACCLLILLFVRDELRYDRFHEHADRIYRVTSDWGDFSLPATNPPLARALKADFPQFPLAHMMPYEGLVRHEAKTFSERFLFASPETFDVFTVELLRGDASSALVEPNTVLLTEATARKYFGEADPMGQRLQVDNQFEVEVVGIVKAFPEQSHVHFDLLGSFATVEPFTQFSTSMRWGNNSFYTYLLLPEGYDPKTLEAQLPELIERHAGDDWNGSELGLQALTDIHLRSHHNAELEPNSNIAYVWVFSAIALFILLVACINFMNLSTARSAERAREVGVRKVVGAARRQLVAQFLAESVLLSGLALVLAVALVALSLPAFRALSGKAVGLSVLDDGFMLLAFFGITLGVGILAGSYPALVLSGFRPVHVLKGAFRASRGGVALRKGLVVFQFATSIALIVGTVVVYQQLDYLRSASLGFDQEQVLVVPFENNEVRQDFAALRAQLLQQPGVLAVSIASEGLPSELLNGNGTALATATQIDFDEGRFVPTRTVAVGHGFFEVLGVEMAHGRSFSQDFATDSSAFILNATAARILQERMPEQVASVEALVGQELRMGMTTGPLVGIAADFNMSTLHEAVEPVVFFFRPGWYDHLLVRVAPGDLPATLATVQQQWNAAYPDWPFVYHFADEAFEARYRAEERLAQVFLIFAGLALFIACLGLFGLAAYMALQRTKEIGVRKVMGASVPQLLVLLNREFVALVAVAFVVAAPLAYFAMDRWLETFAYRHALSWGTFVGAGVVALVIALLAVSYQSARAALADPVDALRYE